MTEDVQKAQESIDREGQPKANRKSQASILVEIATSEAELWRCDDEPWATVQVGNHKEHWPMNNKAFRRGWLSRSFYLQEGKPPGGQALTDALNTLRGIALYDGGSHQVFTRIGGYNGHTYLDLANEGWEVVKITPTGWTITTDAPVRFQRRKGMLPLCIPQKGGKVEELRRFVNVTNEDWPLLLGALVAAFRDKGPYPVLVLNGEQGSAKSTTERVIRALIDPNKAPLRSEPRDPRDLMIAATNSWVVALDNLSHILPWLSDALCRLSTGGGFGTRQLFTDDDETLFDAQRPVILNGIEEIVTRPDLLDRSLVIRSPRIPEGLIRSEKVLWQEFEDARPRILGALLDAVVLALRNVGTVNLEKLPRMADFAIWAIAAEPALGLSRGEFMTAYTGNRDDAHALVLESSPVAKLVTEAAPFAGTATELLTLLDSRAPESLQHGKSWPKDGRALSNTLRRLAPNLRAVGTDVTFGRSGSGRKRARFIKLASIVPEQEEEIASLPSSSSGAGVGAVVEADVRATSADAGAMARNGSVSATADRPSLNADATDARLQSFSDDPLAFQLVPGGEAVSNDGIDEPARSKRGQKWKL